MKYKTLMITAPAPGLSIELQSALNDEGIEIDSEGSLVEPVSELLMFNIIDEMPAITPDKKQHKPWGKKYRRHNK